jgi:hypothetical protein
MAEKKRVYVYKETGFIDSYRVYPAVTILRKNDSIELVNCTDVDAEWEVPAGVLAAHKVTKSVKKRKSDFLDATIEGPAGAEYEVKVGGKKAQAQSDPVIIIDP